MKTDEENKILKETLNSFNRMSAGYLPTTAKKVRTKIEESFNLAIQKTSQLKDKEISDLKKKVFEVLKNFDKDESIYSEVCWFTGGFDVKVYKNKLKEELEKAFDSQEQENNTGSAVRGSAELSPDNSPQTKQGVHPVRSAQIDTKERQDVIKTTSLDKTAEKFNSNRCKGVKII